MTEGTGAAAAGEEESANGRESSNLVYYPEFFLGGRILKSTPGWMHTYEHARNMIFRYAKRVVG